MRKKLAVIFSAVILAMLITACNTMNEGQSDAEEALGDLRGRENVVIVEWGHRQGDVPDFPIPQEGESSDPSEEYPLELPPEEDDTAPDNLASDFAFYDAYGNEVRLSDFLGKPIVLNFWTTWCISCVRETPYFQRLYDEMGGDLHILKVNLLDGQRETREQVDDFMTDNEYTFPLFFDTGAGADEYGIRFIPMTFFIDANGVLVSYVQGTADWDILMREIAEIRE